MAKRENQRKTRRSTGQKKKKKKELFIHTMRNCLRT